MTQYEKNRSIYVFIVLALSLVLFSGCGKKESSISASSVAEETEDSKTVIIPKTTLDTEPFLEYTEPTDTLFTGKLGRKPIYFDHDYPINLDITLTNDKVSAELINEPID